MRLKKTMLLVAVAGSLGSAGRACAQPADRTWSGAGGGLWAVNGNWTPNTFPNNQTMTPPFQFYTALITAGGNSVVYNIPNGTISRLNLGAGRSLTLNTNTALTAGGDLFDLTTDLCGVLNVNGAGAVFTALKSAFSCNSGQIFATAGGQAVVGASTYSPTGLGAVTLLSADGTGSLVDLQTLTSINDAWDVCCNSFAHTISATNSGHVDLRNVATITGPGGDEQLHITAGTGGLIDLSGLSSVSGSGNGTTRFVIADASTLSLPAIQTLSRVMFQVTGGGQIHAAGAGPAQFISSGIGFETTLMSAAGVGTELDLRALTSINDAWDVCCNSYAHTISATNGGHIDLRNVATITGPGGDERLEIAASTGAAIDLSSLSTIVLGGGSGRVNATLTAGARLDLGSLDVKTGSTISVTDSGTVLHALGLKSSTGSSVAININSDGSRLEVDGSLLLGSSISLAAAGGSAVTIGGDFAYAHTDESKVQLDKATVHFNGAGVQHCEVGGIDLASPCTMSDGGFGIGQLIVGDLGGSTTVRLEDLVDNGNRQGNRIEALYLWGNYRREVLPPNPVPCGPSGPAVNGLEIRGGSTLELGPTMNVYAFQNSQWICLMPPANGAPIPFGGGFIRRYGCYVNCDNSTAAPVINTNDFQCFLNRFAEQNCYANCDGSTSPPLLNANDFQCFLNRYAAGCS